MKTKSNQAHYLDSSIAAALYRNAFLLATTATRSSARREICKGYVQLTPGDSGTIGSSFIDPICLHSICVDGLKLRFKSEILLRPFYDDSGNHVCIKHDAHSIYLFASTREELIDIVKEHYAFLWEEYVLADPDTLSPKALALAENLKRDLVAE